MIAPFKSIKLKEVYTQIQQLNLKKSAGFYKISSNVLKEIKKLWYEVFTYLIIFLEKGETTFGVYVVMIKDLMEIHID